MFTGIVEELGTVVARSADRLELRGPLVTKDVADGDSIAVNGVCLTVVAVDGDAFTADVMAETWKRSSLGELAPGDVVNLERAATPTTRLGGHLVQGHVDGVGTVIRVSQHADARLIDLRVPDEIARISIPLGSITVDGVSLTVNAISAPGTIQISLIPFTLEHTTLGERGVGDRVHLEGDTIGKYVAAMMKGEGRKGKGEG